MKVTSVLIKGWANSTALLFSPNTKADVFNENLNKYINENLKGFNELASWDTLRGKNASHKVLIKGKYWRGSWNEPTTEVVTIFYK